ncbi:unnamed protein product [Linum trigynum]|uniref:B3 domain-containing protein n=1 Tax=Linum trigynum TaxID=586398 RepID=A0AAV2C7E9_9ROSI
MLLTMDDVKENLDFSNMKNKKPTPFDWLLAITPIALEKLHLQEKHERLAQESKLKRPIIVPPPPPTTTALGHHDDDQETTPSKKRKRNIMFDGSSTREKKANVMRNRMRRRIDRDYFVDDPRLEQATIPERFRHHIETRLNGRDIKLIVQKRLYASDLDPNEGRLSIPVKKTMCGGLLLTRDEEEWLRDRGHDGKKAVPGMELKLVVDGPEVGEGRIVFKLWAMKKKNGRASYMYVLARYWNDVVKAHRLGEREVVQVWGFRMGEGELGLALVRLGKEYGGD